MKHPTCIPTLNPVMEIHLVSTDKNKRLAKHEKRCKLIHKTKTLQDYLDFYHQRLVKYKLKSHFVTYRKRITFICLILRGFVDLPVNLLSSFSMKS